MLENFGCLNYLNLILWVKFCYNSGQPGHKALQIHGKNMVPVEKGNAQEPQTCWRRVSARSWRADKGRDPGAKGKSFRRAEAARASVEERFKARLTEVGSWEGMRIALPKEGKAAQLKNLIY